MTIRPPSSLEGRSEAAARRGRFASVDVAMAEADRLLRREPAQAQPPTSPGTNADEAIPRLIGALRDSADLRDRPAAHTMNIREERPWRLPTGDLFLAGWLPRSDNERAESTPRPARSS